MKLLKEYNKLVIENHKLKKSLEKSESIVERLLDHTYAVCVGDLNKYSGCLDSDIYSDYALCKATGELLNDIYLINSVGDALHSNFHTNKSKRILEIKKDIKELMDKIDEKLYGPIEECDDV